MSHQWKGLDIKLLTALILLALTNLAYERDVDPLIDCCELLEALIVFDPDPVELEQGTINADTTATYTGGDATWTILTGPPAKYVKSSNIGNGPAGRVSLLLESVPKFPRSSLFRDRPTMKVRATPVDTKKKPESRSLRLRPVELVLELRNTCLAGGFCLRVGPISSADSVGSKAPEREKAELVVFKNRGFPRPEAPGPWEYSWSPDWSSISAVFPGVTGGDPHSLGGGGVPFEQVPVAFILDSEAAMLEARLTSRVTDLCTKRFPSFDDIIGCRFEMDIKSNGSPTQSGSTSIFSPTRGAGRSGGLVLMYYGGYNGCKRCKW